MVSYETVRLSAHEKFIIDGIKRQAGSVEKAVLELVMNAIEAQLALSGKPRVEITFDPEGNGKLVVSDLGRGFKNRNEIEQWFAKFGTPHNECPECQKTMTLQNQRYACVCGYKTEGRTWAEFRMGRGQAFAFGRNVWRTGKFRMEYDLETDPDERTYAHTDGTENHILDFNLQSGLPDHKGCEVTVHFYKNPIGSAYSSIEAFKAKIKHHIEFIEGVILFNGEQINTPASECDWDVETDDAYFMFGRGNNLALYNIGAFVNDHSASDMGVTGVAVSKQKMIVNFARNDVLQSCEVWKRIRIIIRENRKKRIYQARRRLDKDERICMLLELRDGSVDYCDVKTLGLFELTDGKIMSLDAIRKIRSPWTFADRGDRIADHLMQVGSAICFCQETAGVLNYSGDTRNFFSWLMNEHYERTDFDSLLNFHREFHGLAGGYSNVHRIIPTDKLSKAERRFLAVMEAYGCWKGRSLCIGVSTTANGWTDGHSYIAFNRKYIHRHNPQCHSGAAAILTLAFHEMAHDTDDTGSHNHNVEFYQSYHELTRGRALEKVGDLPNRLRNQKWQDQATEKAEQEAKKKEQRDAKLGIKRVAKGQKVAADGIAHKPTKPKAVDKKKRSRRKMRF